MPRRTPTLGVGSRALFASLASPTVAAWHHDRACGYAIVLIGLLASAAFDRIAQSLGAPLFMPLIAIGLILLAVASRESTALDARARTVLLSIGVLLAVSLAWAFVPLEVSDAVGGYRIYGFMAHFLTGLGWALFGVLTARRVRADVLAPADLG